jgi:hypothetical protein
MITNLVGPPNSEGQPEGLWLNATYVIAAVTIYWARALFMIYQQGNEPSDYSGPYIPINETIVSNRQTLDASALLYLVLVIQPIITIAALVVTIWLYNVPIGKGFGIVSILSGYETTRSQSIAGAGLSGKLKAAVSLEVFPTITNQYDSSPILGSIEDARLRYRLTSESKIKEMARLQKSQTYW